ncbi:Hypothetical protein SSCIU_01610 [Mammaliicoccus sciuri]|nr:Hypothetical protein SSCIU_01610 [Mammaliicoccus sciuri]
MLLAVLVRSANTGVVISSFS